MDLATEWRSRRWRRLLNLIDGLPRNTHYVEAVATDEALAEQFGDQPSGPPVERWVDFSPEREAILVVADRIAELVRVQVLAAGGKAPQVKPLPRPTTVLNGGDAKFRRRMQTHRRLVAQLLPHKATPPPP